MNDLVNIISNANPVIAAALILLGITVAMLRKGTDSRLKSVEKRLDEYDKLHIAAMLAQIQSDLSWIKSTLLYLSKEHEQ